MKIMKSDYYNEKNFLKLKNILINTGRDDSSYSFEILNTTDWVCFLLKLI